MIKRFWHRYGNAAGFSLVEVLVVMVIMGLVVSAIMSLYVNMQKTSGSSEEVVEIQQGVRIALDRIALDLRMAGFLVLNGPVSEAKSDTITLRSATSNNTYARVRDEAIVLNAGDVLELKIEPANMALMFNEGDRVQVVNPVTGSVLARSDAEGLTAVDDDDTSSDHEQLDGSGVYRRIRFKADAPATVSEESMVVRANGVNFNTITYVLNGTNLVRSLNGEAAGEGNTLVGKVSKLKFTYILDKGIVVSSLPDNDPLLKNIRAVRVELETTTVDTAVASGGAKVRGAETTVRLHNR